MKNLSAAEKTGLRLWGVICLLLLAAFAYAQAPIRVNHRGFWFACLPNGTTSPDFTFQTKTSTAGHKVLSIKDDLGTEVWSISREGVVNRAASEVRATADLTATSNTTLAAVTGLSVNLVAGQKYIISGKLFTTSTANGGLKIAFGGTATATAILAETKFYNGTTQNVSTQVTSLGALAGSTVATDSAQFWAYISCNAGGTLTIQAAQNASHADTTTVKTGSYMSAGTVS